MKIYQLYITEASLDRTGHWNEVAWSRNVKATCRTGALSKCLPEIKKQVLPQIEDATIKFVAVYCGEKAGRFARANRLHPMQITREGKIRA